MLNSIVSIAKIADLGIADMQFEINNKLISDIDELLMIYLWKKNYR